MEATTLLRSSSPFLKPSNFISKSSLPPANRPEFLCFSTNSRSSNRWIKHCHAFSLPKHGQRRFVLGGRRNTVIRASAADGSSSSSDLPIAPLQLESPVGQFLSQILKSHPHLLPAAVDQQLQQLQTDRDAEKQKEDPPSIAGTDLVLYRRIAEVKANDRKKTVEEILYALVVQKFVDANVSLIPSVSSTPADPSGRVDSWPSQDEKVVRLHSEEAFEMIENHLSLILGNRLEDSNSVAQISKLRVGHVYAASVMYGYFLRRVDQRFQLEKTMKVLPQGLDKQDSDIVQSLGEEMKKSVGSEEYSRVENVQSHPEVSSWSGSFGEDGFGNRIKASRLRNYVMNFDGETLQRYATARSKEAVSIIEKHTEALFGRPEIVITPEGVSSKDELIKISFGGLKRLVLEAVTFGSFLWDVESYVDSRELKKLDPSRARVLRNKDVNQEGIHLKCETGRAIHEVPAIMFTGRAIHYVQSFLSCQTRNDNDPSR